MERVESIFVTGANRGIGLEFVRQFVNLPQPPKHVFASFRSIDTIQALEDIKNESQRSEVTLIKMDVRNLDDIKAAQKLIEEKLGDRGLNLLINNAGACELQGFPNLTDQNMLFHFTTNTLGPLNVLQGVLPLLQKSSAREASGLTVFRAAVLNITSVGGSIQSVTNLSNPRFLQAVGYRVSKTALNMAMRVAAVKLQSEGILVIQMCPGYVRTDMCSNKAELHVSESVSAMIKTLSQLDESDHGRYYDRHENPIPY